MARRARRGTLNPKIPSDELTQALHYAAGLMKTFKRRVLTVELLLYTYIKLPDTNAHRILRKLAEQRGINWATFEEQAAQAAQERITSDVDFDFEVDAGQRIALGDDVLYTIDEGLSLAESRHETRCGSDHTLVFMTQRRVSTHRMLGQHGITRHAVEDQLTDPALSSHAAARDHVALARNGGTSLYLREKLLQDLTSLLSMAANRHVVLVGSTGVGKQSLAHSLAQLIAQGAGPIGLASMIEMNEQALLDNALSTVRTGIRLARGGILYVPNIARFFGGFRAEFPEKACAELMKAFYDNDVVILGTSTPGRFDDRLASSDIIIQNCHILKVPPTDQPETAAILQVLKPAFEADYGLTIVEESLPVVARLAGRYLTTNPLPGAAIHLLHRTCVQVNLSARSSGDDSQPQIDKTLDVEDVMVSTSLLTGIPVSSMGADERDRYAHMVEHLHKRIIGQEEALLALSRAVRMARVGLKDPKRPIGSFMFMGPTGVGKSELAKALAEFMFTSEDALITLDMSEYMDESAVNRLIGSPPGYVGHEAGGQLTDAIREKPYSVVLFDEVEKAALKVFDVLLQILDEGRLTSGKGETVSFSECVILMTSNIGSRYLADPELGEAAREAAEAELKAHFRPEFLNRLDDIIFFHPLTDEHLRQILDLMLKRENQLLANRNLNLSVSEAAKSWILSKNEHPEWGARPLRRLIAQYIRTPLTNFLLQEEPQDGATLKVEVAEGQLKIEF